MLSQLSPTKKVIIISSLSLLFLFVMVGLFYYYCQGCFLGNEIKPATEVVIIQEEEVKQPVSSAPNQSLQKNIFIATDKTEYKMDEVVIVTIQNKSEDFICFPEDACGCNKDPAYILEKYQENEWVMAGEEISLLRCHVGPCLGSIDLEANQDVATELLRTLIPNTKYRFALSVGFEHTDEVGAPLCRADYVMYSNEFTISDQPELIKQFEGSIVEFDPTPLQVGEIKKVGIKTSSGKIYQILGREKEAEILMGKKVRANGYLTKYGVYYGIYGQGGPILYAIDVEMSWQPYKNEEFGFEFSYPATWKIDTEEMKQFIPDWKVQEQEPSFGVGMFDNEDKLSIEEWVDKNDFLGLKALETAEYVSYGAEGPIIIQSESDIEVTVYFGGASGGGTFGTGIIRASDKIIVVAYTWLPPSPDYEKIEEIFKNILKTFKLK